MTNDDGRYKSVQPAIRVLSAVETGEESFSATPAGPENTDLARYVGQSPQILAHIDSPAQWDDSLVPGPTYDTAVYEGRSEAIHVFGDQHPVTPPPPVPGCQCCLEAARCPSFSSDANCDTPTGLWCDPPGYTWDVTGDGFNNGSSNVLLPFDSGTALAQSNASIIAEGPWNHDFLMDVRFLFLTVPSGSSHESEYMIAVGGANGAAISFHPSTSAGEVTIWSGSGSPLVGSTAAELSRAWVANTWYRMRWEHKRGSTGQDRFAIWEAPAIDTPWPGTWDLTFSGFAGANPGTGLQLFDIALAAHRPQRWYFDYINIDQTSGCTGAGVPTFDESFPTVHPSDWGPSWIADPSSGSATYYTTTSGIGIFSTSASAAPGLSVDAPPIGPDFEMTARVIMYGPSSDASLGWSFGFRVLAGAAGSGFLGGSAYARIDGFNATTGAPAFALATGTTSPTTVTAPAVFPIDAWFFVKWQRTGNTHRMKIWLDDGSAVEPSTWALEQAGIPSFTIGRFGVVMQGRPDAELDYDYIRIGPVPTALGDCSDDCSSCGPSDEFNRTLTTIDNEWGTGDSGQVWTHYSPETGAYASVDGSSGQVDLVPQTFGVIAVVMDTSDPLPSGSWQMTTRFKVSTIPTGSGAGPVNRNTDIDLSLYDVGFNRVRIIFSVSSAMGYGEVTAQDASIDKTDWVADTWYNARLAYDIAGSSSFRIWPDGTAEPSTWDGTSTAFAGFAPTLMEIIATGDRWTAGAGTLPTQTINIDFIRFQCDGGGGGGGCDCTECNDPITGIPIPPFTPGYLPTFRRQIGDPTTSLDSFICTLESGAMLLDWQTRGAVKVWGGELIPYTGRSEASIYGHGATLGNLRQAWLHWNQTLSVRTGQSFDDLLAALGEGRAAVIQGDYDQFNLAERCQDSFLGDHAILVLPYENSGRILCGDPLCTTFHGILESTLRNYTEKFGRAVLGTSSPQGILFAVSRAWTP